MMRRASGLGAVLGGLSLWGAMALVGCAPPPAVLDEATRTEVEGPTTAVLSSPPAAEAAAAVTGDSGLEIRELKVIDDNGQQGVFAKLSRAPREVSHFTLANPNRIVVELIGETPGQ